MDDDDLLKRLRQEIARDNTPVQPLRAPWMRALLPVAACLALGGLVVVVAGVRPDSGVVGAWRLLGFSAIQVACCGGLFAISLRWSIPAMGGSLWTALVCASGALLVQALLTWAVLARSALSPPAGLELRTGLACVTAITLVSLAPIVTGTVLLMRGLLTRWLAAFALTGFAGGLAAEALWRLHCPYSIWRHVLPFHWGPVLLAVLVVLTVATYVDRRAWSPATTA